MRVFLTGCVLVALAACQPKIPDSAAGVGFDNAVNSPQAQKQIDAQLTQVPPIPPANSVSQETLATLQRTSVTTTAAPVPAPAPVATAPVAVPPPAPQPVQVASVPAPTPASPAPSAPATTEPAAPARTAPDQPQTTPDGVVHASPSNPAPVLMNNPGLSNENDFAAVGARRSIDDDAARLANAKANYQVISPTAVPKRQGNGAPNIVAYALQTKNPVGTKVYTRVGLKNASRHEQACAAYPSANEAQAAFLAKGGPKRDRLGLDPDGDGFACKWDPAPYRAAAGG
ncbi:hypothetical protein [Shimia sp. SDUM112013]|uniref:hypothetical protein n=1 Tax=Shimia sp. SDUM112013 TaxID=3136160 RepID=UPI0032EE9DE4